MDRFVSHGGQEAGDVYINLLMIFRDWFPLKRELMEYSTIQIMKHTL